MYLPCVTTETNGGGGLNEDLEITHGTSQTIPAPEINKAKKMDERGKNLKGKKSAWITATMRRAPQVICRAGSVSQAQCHEGLQPPHGADTIIPQVRKWGLVGTGEVKQHAHVR